MGRWRPCFGFSSRRAARATMLRAATVQASGGAERFKPQKNSRTSPSPRLPVKSRAALVWPHMYDAGVGVFAQGI